jgi:putative effector of murein hydrolase
MGTVAHGIGTARALSENPVAGAFSGLAMGLNALLTALLLPLLWHLVGGG